MYVRVVGKTRMYQDQLQVTAFDVTPVIDHNEVTYHFLNCAAVHLKNTTTAPAAAAASGSLNPGFAYGARPDVVAEAKPMAMDVGGDLSGVQSKVLAIIAENSLSEEGVGITTLCSQLGASVSEAEIRNAIDFLSSEGHLYSTIDEDHFKATSVD